MSPRRAATVAAPATVTVVAIILFAGANREIALLVYVLLLCALVLAGLLSRLRQALPPAPAFKTLLAGRQQRSLPLDQFETIRRRIRLASHGSGEMHVYLRPLVRDVVEVQLARRYGIDLEREPESAHAVLGEGRVWELVRPDREIPRDGARGWPPGELEELIEELEGLRWES